MTDIVERLWVKANRPYAVEASLIAEAAAEITGLRSALSEAEKDRDQLKKDLGSTNAALSICGYGGDTHAGMLAAQKVTMKLAKEYLARAEKAEAELAQARKALEKAVLADTFDGSWLDEAVAIILTDTGLTESEHFSPDFIGISDVMRGRTEGEQK